MAVFPTSVMSIRSDERQPGVGGDVPDEAVQSLHDRAPQLLQPLGVLHRIGDPRDHILAEGDLGIHDRSGGDHLSALQAAKVPGHGGRAQVDGEAEELIDLARKERDDFGFHPDGRGDGPVSLPESPGEAEESVVVDLRTRAADLLRECGGEPLVIGLRIVELGRAERYGVKTDRRIEHDLALSRLLADHLASAPALCREEDREIAVNGGRAGQTEPLSPLLFPDEFCFLVGEWGEMVGMGGDAMALEGSRLHADAAFPAGALPAADRFDPDPEHPGCFENGLPLRYLPPPAGGLKNHPTALHLRLPNPISRTI